MSDSLMEASMDQPLDFSAVDGCEHDPTLAASSQAGQDLPAIDLPDQGAQRAERFARRRRRLYAFQAQLSEQLQRARSEQESATRRLGVVLGAHHCLLELDQAGEVVPAQGITPVPWTRAWFLGLINLRGHLIGVVDGAAWLGLAPTTIDRDCRIVALAPGLGLQCGLLVSRVTGLHDLRNLQAAPNAARPEALQPWSTQAFTDDTGRNWTALDLNTLARDPGFVQVAPSAGPALGLSERLPVLGNALPVGQDIPKKQPA